MDKIVGRREFVTILELGIAVLAKIDTGAYRSSIHCTDYTIKDDIVDCNILGKHRLKLESQGWVKVRSSNGEHERRPIVILKCKFAGKTRDILFTLTDRSNMNCPILIGRTALSDMELLVDSREKHLHESITPTWGMSDLDKKIIALINKMNNSGYRLVTDEEYDDFWKLVDQYLIAADDLIERASRTAEADKEKLYTRLKSWMNSRQLLM